MLKTTFSKHQLIKISMKYVYTEHEVKNNDATVMATAMNEACIG